MGTLRRRDGAPDDTYDVTGSLDGIRPGSRNVRHLRVARLKGERGEGLRPLAAFGPLEVLELVDIVGVDLSPLAELEITRLQLTDLEHVDLAPLARIDRLSALGIGQLRDCQVPDRLRLPATLQELFLVNDAPSEAGAPIEALIKAIDWRQLNNLRALDVRVGGLEGADAISVDGAFLAGLTKLERLRLEPGVWLDPPFDGLPQGLRSISLDAWEPKAVRARLKQQYPEAQVLVQQRFGPAPAGLALGDRAARAGRRPGGVERLWQPRRRGRRP